MFKKFKNMEVPQDFPFPFNPYPIQVEFMKNLYLCLENNHLGIFESPTGTGKTLSIICGALKWLTDHQKKKKESLFNEQAALEQKIKIIETNTENDWFSLQTELIKLNLEKNSLQIKNRALLKQEERKLKYKRLKECNEKLKMDKQSKNIKYNVKYNKNKLLEIEENITQFIDEDLILNDIDYKSDSSEEEETEEVIYQNCKIFFCSRTHSQLTQFVKEFKRSPYCDTISLVPLASRNNYCINSKIRSLKNINIINEQCQILQKSKSVKSKKESKIKHLKISTSCPFLPGKQSLLMAEILTQIYDIEEIVKKSEELETCPYYAARKSVEDGEVILVPYNSVLHKNTRKSLGINLKGNILIIDEAHNLLEAIERMYSVTVTGRNILCCLNQLFQYKKKFENVLTAKNVLFYDQLYFCLKKLLKLFGGNIKSHPDDKIKNIACTKLYTIHEFEAIAEIDNLNIFDLINFIQKSKLVHKLQKYIEKYQIESTFDKCNEEKNGVTTFLQCLNQQENIDKQENLNKNINNSKINHISNPIITILSFLESLIINSNDGRVFVVSESTIGRGYLKFILLNPSALFSDIVQEAKSVIVTGGTMEPMSEFKEQLFINAGAPVERIFTFSCDHIIPKENILTCIIKSGPTNQEFEFNYQNRQNIKILDELANTLINLCSIIPAGIVVFLPSYDYEDLLFKYLKLNGYVKKINMKKRIFREPKLPSQVNEILEKYSCTIKNPLKPQNGAILFSVIGGKLSEGLNFSDDLGRCIVIIGLPYPNLKSPELQEKIKYLNENVNPNAGQIFYENLCMKAVNQCIGRAVRHIADYSTVVLLDKRYNNKKKALPHWIQKTVTVHSNFKTGIEVLKTFFNCKKKTLKI